MANKAELSAQLEFHKEALDAARAAYIALLNGQTQSYTIGGRSLTRLDLPKLREEIAYNQKEVDTLTALISGQSRRRAVGIVPLDW